MALNNRGFLVAVLLAAVAVGNAAAATFVVGDGFGWGVPMNSAFYSNWTSQHVFTVGDVLVFNFMTGQHDVAQVSKAAYDSCSSTAPILLKTEGPWNTTLNSTGDHYYICTFGVHCSLGQKLAINVTASSATPSPAPAPMPLVPTPAPTPSGSPSPSPGSSPTPTPTPSPGLTPASPPGEGGVTPPPSPSTGVPSDGLSPPPPPPPSSATISTLGAPAVGFALAMLGLMI